MAWPYFLQVDHAAIRCFTVGSKVPFYQSVVETDTCPKWATAGAIRQSLRPRLHGLFYPLQRWESKP